MPDPNRVRDFLLALAAAYGLEGLLRLRWIALMKPLIQQAIAEEAAAVAEELEAALTPAEPVLEQLAAHRVAALVEQVTETTRDGIRAAVERGMAEGWGTRRIASAIKAETSGAIAGDRAVLIARTETIGAVNAGQLAAARASGVVEGKEWLTVGDDRVRETHADQDGMIVALTERFPNGCLYPGDPAGGPAEVCNCRCSLAFHRTAA